MAGVAEERHPSETPAVDGITVDHGGLEDDLRAAAGRSDFAVASTPMRVWVPPERKGRPRVKLVADRRVDAVAADRDAVAGRQIDGEMDRDGVGVLFDADAAVVRPDAVGPEPLAHDVEDDPSASGALGIAVDQLSRAREKASP